MKRFHLQSLLVMSLIASVLLGVNFQKYDGDGHRMHSGPLIWLADVTTAQGWPEPVVQRRVAWFAEYTEDVNSVLLADDPSNRGEPQINTFELFPGGLAWNFAVCLALTVSGGLLSERVIARQDKRRAQRDRTRTYIRSRLLENQRHA